MKNKFKKKLIFDLDNTLYSPLIYPEKNYEYNFQKFYVDLKSDLKLGQLLKKSENYLFTNANKEHMDLCLTKMRIKGQFKDTIYNDLYKGYYKPHKQVYHMAIEKFNLKKDDSIYFFEDLKSNLKTAHEFGWKTVYLDYHKTMKKKHSYIDYKFDNIYDAITFIQNI